LAGAFQKLLRASEVHSVRIKRGVSCKIGR
jgi:hypothetical protein